MLGLRKFLDALRYDKFDDFSISDGNASNQFRWMFNFSRFGKDDNPGNSRSSLFDTSNVVMDASDDRGGGGGGDATTPRDDAGYDEGP